VLDSMASFIGLSHTVSSVKGSTWFGTYAVVAGNSAEQWHWHQATMAAGYGCFQTCKMKERAISSSRR